MKIRLNALAMMAASFVTASLATTAPAQVVDLSQLGTTHPGFRIDGIGANDNSGRSVSGAGDVNGDGLADVIVSAPRAAPGGDIYAGESYVVFGKTGSAAVSLASLGAGGFRIDGIDAGDQSGRSVSGAGDVNGDGLADLIVGAPSADPNGNSEAGESYVIFGKANTTGVDLANLGAGGFRIDGIAGNDRSGSSVSGAGDVNGDGLADLIVGARFADPNGNSEAGESYVVFGKTGSAAVSLASLGASGFRIDGIGADDNSGLSVSGAGDVNGDGLADLIVGAPYADPNGSDSGESYVVFGKTDSAAVSPASLGAGGFRIDGIDFLDRCGFAVSGAGDVNGDGLADLIVGATFADPNGNSAGGESYVIFGKTGSAAVSLATLEAQGAGFRIDGIDSIDRSGSAVSGAGDVNGDGLADLIVGAPYADPNGNDSGESYVVFGKSTSTPINLTSLTASEGFRVDGIDANDRSGFSISGAGDVNGDGLADLIVGSPLADPNGSDSGESYVVFGPGPGVTAGTVLGLTSIAVAGDAPAIVIGQGDGTHSNPARTVVDFADGNLGRVTAQIDKSTPLPSPFIAGTNAAPIIWEVSTARTFTSADVTFQYTDEEITGLTEADLRLYTASSIGGAWAEIPSTLDAATNRITATGVSSFSFFLLSDVAGLPVELDSFLVE